MKWSGNAAFMGKMKKNLNEKSLRNGLRLDGENNTVVDLKAIVKIG